jgi:hypothetical protein
MAAEIEALADRGEKKESAEPAKLGHRFQHSVIAAWATYQRLPARHDPKMANAPCRNARIGILAAKQNATVTATFFPAYLLIVSSLRVLPSEALRRRRGRAGLPHRIRVGECATTDWPRRLSYCQRRRESWGADDPLYGVTEFDRSHRFHQ